MNSLEAVTNKDIKPLLQYVILEIILSPIQIILNNLTGALLVWAAIFLIYGNSISYKEERMLDDNDLLTSAAVASFFAVIVFVVLTIIDIQ